MGRFIDVRMAERHERLQLFQQEVRQRVREQVNETQRVVGRHVRKVVRPREWCAYPAIWSFTSSGGTTAQWQATI